MKPLILAIMLTACGTEEEEPPACPVPSEVIEIPGKYPGSKTPVGVPVEGQEPACEEEEK